MNIFVCIKQVPSTSKVQVDEKTGVLKRDGVASKMNPYDLYALETALRLREEHGGRVTVGSGTLYNLLEQFLEAGMIRETRAEGRRRRYVLTEAGRRRLEEEYRRICAQGEDYRRIMGEEVSR